MRLRKESAYVTTLLIDFIEVAGRFVIRCKVYARVAPDHSPDLFVEIFRKLPAFFVAYIYYEQLVVCIKV